MPSPIPRRTLTSVAVLGVAVLLAGAGGATAGSLVTSAQIKDGTVSTKDVRNGTIALADLAPATRSGLRGLTGYQMVRVASEPVPDGSSRTIAGECPTGKKVLGASAFWVNQHAIVEVYPADTESDTTWNAFGSNQSGSADQLVIVVTCARVA
jgi:hypothetical protein